jgi:hemerythrin
VFDHHQEIINALAAFKADISNSSKQIDFFNITSANLRAEEELMREIKFPHRREHTRWHRNLEDKMSFIFADTVTLVGVSVIENELLLHLGTADVVLEKFYEKYLRHQNQV